MNERTNGNELGDWLQDHAANLDGIADDNGLSHDDVQFVAALVLSGITDDEILASLHEHHLSMDGQHSPFGAVPQVIFEIRLLVAQS